MCLLCTLVVKRDVGQGTPTITNSTLEIACFFVLNFKKKENANVKCIIDYICYSKNIRLYNLVVVDCIKSVIDSSINWFIKFSILWCS